MRQRAKIAASLVTEPRVMVLDEPLNGADPVQRVALIDLFQALGDQGRTVIISSHVLHEVERLAARQLVIVRGRLAAAGGHRAIRDALADRPRAVLVRTTEPRRLAGDLLASEAVQGVTVDGDTLVVSSTHAGELADPPAGRRPGRGRPPARGPAPRRLARERLPGAAPMTTTDAARGRRPGAGAPARRPLRGRGRLHAAGLPAGQAVARGAAAVRRRPALRLADPARRPTRRRSAFADVAEGGLFRLILPLTCLVIGDAVLGADVRAGTFSLTWLSPVPFRVIVAGRWLGGWLVALVTLVPAMALAAVVAGVPEAAGPIAIADGRRCRPPTSPCSCSSACWSAARRCGPWPSSSSASGCSAPRSPASPRCRPLWESQQVFAGLWEYGELIERSGMPSGWGAILRLALITLVALALAVWRVAHMRPLAGDD